MVGGGVTAIERRALMEACYEERDMNEELITAPTAELPAMTEERAEITRVPQVPDSPAWMTQFLETTEAEQAALLAPIDEALVEIRPDGIVYLPWTFYRDRLDQAFGPGNWQTIPDGKPKLEDKTIIHGHYLVVRGCYTAQAYGGCQYIPTNRTMSYDDAIEGAWANALMRCCKRLGVAKELWEPAWREEWKKKYAQKKGAKWAKNSAGTKTEPQPEKPEKPKFNRKSALWKLALPLYPDKDACKEALDQRILGITDDDGTQVYPMGVEDFDSITEEDYQKLYAEMKDMADATE